jgi:hypothetical protein
MFPSDCATWYKSHRATKHLRAVPDIDAILHIHMLSEERVEDYLALP